LRIFGLILFLQLNFDELTNSSTGVNAEEIYDLRSAATGISKRARVSADSGPKSHVECMQDIANLFPFIFPENRNEGVGRQGD
jgi:hypothetical protein